MNSTLPIERADKSSRGDESRNAGPASGAPERPRTETRRGGTQSRPTGFYGYLTRLPGPQRVPERVNDWAAALPTGPVRRLGEWTACTRWTTTPAPLGEIAPAPTKPDEPPENVELLQILGAIAEEVTRHCAAVCAGITADFAVRTAHARRTLPRNEAAAAVHALQQARKAALQFARQIAQSELKARQDAARSLHQRPRRPSTKGGRVPSIGSPRR